MTADRYRTETVICAFSSTTLQPGTWAHDSILASGLCAQTNRLGNLMMHFINESSRESGMPREKATEIILIITSRLMNRERVFSTAHDAAFRAFEYWNGRRCLNCAGRGVMNFQQDECPMCRGSGDRPIIGTDLVKAGISILIEAENWMESQLRHKMSPECVPDMVRRISADTTRLPEDFRGESWVTEQLSGAE